MKSRIFLIIAPLSLCLLATAAISASVYANRHLFTPAVSEEAFEAAREALREVDDIDTRSTGTVMVVDYTQPSYRKRAAILRIGTGDRTYHQVAHGVKSGLVTPTNFSNIPDSNQSSLGLFRIAESYEGKHGFSYRLDGLSGDLNSNARSRNIVLHSAGYVGPAACLLNWHEGFRLGRSEGCFVLSEKDLMVLAKSMEEPAYIFAFGG